MGQLLYDRLTLEERSGKNFSFWKGCHIATYTLAAVFGLLNCYFLYLTCMSFDQMCVLDPHKLVFSPETPPEPTTTLEPATTELVEVANLTELSTVSANIGNDTLFLVLDIPSSEFRVQSYCEWKLTWPLLAAIVAAVWVAMFVVCPAGGHTNHGLPEPWRIVVPALVFSLVFMGITAHTLVQTNRGLTNLCAQFETVTNTTSCVPAMDEHMPPNEKRPLPASVGVILTRAACAASFAAWLVAAAMLLARCLGGADFALHRTQVHLRNNGKTSAPSPRQQLQVSPSDIHSPSTSQQHQQDTSAAGDQLSIASASTLSTELATAREPDRETSLVQIE